MAYTIYPVPTAVHSSPKTKTYSAIAAATAIKTSIATVASPSTAPSYSGGALNGSTGAGLIDLPQTFTVTTSSHAGSYVTSSPIVVTGIVIDSANNQTTVQESLSLTAVNGGETIQGNIGFSYITQIDVPLQNDTSGAFTFGLGDIVPAARIRYIRAGSAGNIIVKYADGTSDTLPSQTAEKQAILAVRVVSTGTTALPVTIYM